MSIGKEKNMKQLLNTWCEAANAATNENLVSVILYGSRARLESHASDADLNLFVVLKEAKLEEIQKLDKSAQKSLRDFSPRLVFWSETELKNAWDVFPLEFLDIKENHEILMGKDPFNKKQPEKKHLRYQLELELRSKLLSMRSAYVQFQADRKAMSLYLIQATKSFEYLHRHAVQQYPKLKTVGRDVFDKSAKMLKQKRTPSKQALEQLFQQLHETIVLVVSRINKA
jgi:predicted nucleotidyltransferase